MILFVGDIHAKKSNLDKQEKLFQLIEERPEKEIFLTGDLLDNKAIVRSECLNFLYDKFRTSSKTFHIVVGNHDQHNLNTLEHSLEPLEALNNVNIYAKTTEFKIGRLQLVAIPYMHSAKDFETEVYYIEDKQDKVLVCHQGFTGFDYGNGYIAKDETSGNCVRDFQEVIVGHFHKFQTLTNGCYIGTPFSQSFGESNQDKYLVTMDETGFWETIKTDFPRHMTYEIDCDKGEKIRKFDMDNYNRIILTGSKEAIDSYDTTLFSESKVLKRPTPATINNSVEISENLSNSKKFEVWASGVGEFDSDLIQLGVEVLKAVSC